MNDLATDLIALAFIVIVAVVGILAIVSIFEEHSGQ